MPTFQSKPLGDSGERGKAGSTFARLTPKSRYDYNATKVQSVSKEQELGMRKDRRRIDIREEYFRLQANDSSLDEWEPKRIARPEGVPEWGVAPITNSVPPLTRQEPNDKDEKAGGSRMPSILRKVYAEERPVGQSDVPFAGGSAKGKTIIGPDGKPCRACNSKLAFSAAMKGGSKAQKPDRKISGTAATKAAAVAGAASLDISSSSGTACPPDGELLGHSTWIFLHSAAAYYPNEPSKTQQSAMLDIIRALPSIYPCFTCAASLGEELKRERSEGASWEGGATLDRAVRSGPGLRSWLCGLHNEVNTRLGKPTWPCNEDTLRRRWLDGPDDGSCD